MNTYILFSWLLILHFVADFILQDRDTATKKSSNFSYLFFHMQIIYLVFFIGLLFLGLYKSFMFSLMNMFIHGLIDWNIWKFYKKGKMADFKYWEDSNFYKTIGFDQLLHTLTLVILLKIFN